ncbi:hypothetical protein ACHAWF_006918, partial [Thalassiosira exigua]
VRPSTHPPRLLFWVCLRLGRSNRSIAGADAPGNGNQKQSREKASIMKRIAVVGGGITGSAACRRLSKCPGLTIHIFDQGRRGVGGRTSSRCEGSDEAATVRFDHGCQFFRADTDRFKTLVKEWTEKGYVSEWSGDFRSSIKQEHEFFGLPSTPPFYVAVGGMQTLARNILTEASECTEESSEVRIHEGVRVAQLNRDAGTKKWTLLGTSGEAAYHDTAEKLQKHSQTNVIGDQLGYDAVILTDVSSSFGGWHRASAGVPDSFAKAVRKRVGARAPLFTAMIAFEKATSIPFDAASFDHPVAWFAAKTSSKPGMSTDYECWTIVSTPNYACQKIEETPMQDPKTGEFIPQSPDYLTTVPGPDLLRAFEEIVCDKAGILGNGALTNLPKHIFMDAQRWGSALPCHRHLRHETSSTRRVLSGVTYDSGLHPLAPTRMEEEDDSKSFLANDDLALYQAGDMMSNHTPGMESAALSGIDAAEHVLSQLGHNI